MKITIVGCGLRTPLLLSAIFEQLPVVDEISLFDTDPAMSELMESLGNILRPGKGTRLGVASSGQEALRGAAFVISSVRAGGMSSRALDERTSFEAGIAGQETIGPAGFAMAIRNVPAVLHYARLMEEVAPSAWLINLANPAGIVTEAIRRHSRIRAVGICDTPQELIFRIAATLAVPVHNIRVEYFGLNHLGWIRSVKVNGREQMDNLLAGEASLHSIYPQAFFDAALLRKVGLLPTEYLYFYYRGRRAWQQQATVGRTRGEELSLLNVALVDKLRKRVLSGDSEGALEHYSAYLNRRDASYLKAEVAGSSALHFDPPRWDPFHTETGYHRIAVATIEALAGLTSRSRLVLNVPPASSFELWPPGSVAEVSCEIQNGAIVPDLISNIPHPARELMQSVKSYELATIEAAISGETDARIWALAQNPLVGDWDVAADLVPKLQL